MAAAIEPPTMPKQPIRPYSRSMTFIDAAAAAVGAGRAAEQLGGECGRIDAERERRTVPAVGRGDLVAGPQRGAHADGDGLLALVEVRRALDLVAHEEAEDGVLEEADPQHRQVQAPRGCSRGRGSGRLAHDDLRVRRDGDVLSRRRRRSARGGRRWPPRRALPAGRGWW